MSFNIEREKGKKRVVIVGGGFRWHLPALSRVLSRFLSGKYSGKNLM